MMPVYHRLPSKRKIHHMNARQRKKFHLGEFQVLNFGVVGQLLSDYCTPEYIDSFFDEVIAFVEAHSFCLYGGGGQDFSFNFEHAQRPNNITAQQRQMIIDWFIARPDVLHLRAGDLIDGFYADAAAFEHYPHIYK